MVGTVYTTTIVGIESVDNIILVERKAVYIIIHSLEPFCITFDTLLSQETSIIAPNEWLKPGLCLHVIYGSFAQNILNHFIM